MRKMTLAILCIFIAIPAFASSQNKGGIVGRGYQRFDGRDFDSNNFVAIAAGYYHSLALKNDGSIVGWGRNNHGQATPPAEIHK